MNSLPKEERISLGAVNCDKISPFYGKSASPEAIRYRHS